MAEAISTQIADHMRVVLDNAILDYYVESVKELNKDDLLGPYGTVVRTYLPEYAVEHSRRPRISILPFNVLSERFARSVQMEDFLIDTIVHQRIGDVEATINVTPDNVRTREEVWRDNVTAYGDRIMTLLAQVRMTFEEHSNSGAAYTTPITNETGCAVRIRTQQDVAYQRAEVENKHIVFGVIRHIWRTYRTVAA